MTCFFCDSENASFGYNSGSNRLLELCLDHRLRLFRALLYDFHRAGLVEEIMKDVVEKGPKSL